MYDIFYVGPETLEWKKIKQKFPFSKRVDDFQTARQKSFTVYFWIVWSDLSIADNFNFDYKVSEWDEGYIHIFQNGNFYDGVCLFSKKTAVSSRELEYRFFTNKKEIDIQASTLTTYDIFYIDTYEEYKEAVATSTTNMFWVVWKDLQISNDFKFDYQVPYHNQRITHMFLNGSFYDGVCLFSKISTISINEFNYRFFTNKKEIAIQASIPAYQIFYIDTYEEYKEAVATSTTNMFWVVWKDLQISNDFKFDYQVPYYDQRFTHVFRNGEFYDGVCLFSKISTVSSKEFMYRFFTNKKEIDIQASKPMYDIFYIDTYEEYKEALATSTTNMFWVVWKDLNINKDFKFDYQVPFYDRRFTHVFRNGEFYDGVCLFSKESVVSSRELEYRFFTNKKEIDIQASTPKPFDVVFISYHEPNADLHYNILTEKLGRYVYRVNGVKGIHNAHVKAANLVSSDLFWVVDADAILEPDFNFEFPQVVHHDTYTKSTVHVWTSRNPINDLQYGNGGVKLLPRKLTLNMDLSKLDMTTSISPSFKSMPAISNIAAFNTDEFTTWRSAFRECVKLSSKTIQGQVNVETEERLNIWCSVGEDRLYGKYAISGALAGRAYGQENAGNLPALALINDYDWLMLQFQQEWKPLEK